MTHSNITASLFIIKGFNCKIFLVSATSITMTQSPSGLVPKDTDITFTCLTDEANPTASVTWTVDGVSRSSSSDSSIDHNNYNALKRQSMLTLTADKTLHNKKVNCVISGNTGVSAEEMLNVACKCLYFKYPFIHKHTCV